MSFVANVVALLAIFLDSTAQRKALPAAADREGSVNLRLLQQESRAAWAVIGG